MATSTGDSITTAEKDATSTHALRLPSNRPIDQRWDRSRGINFGDATRKRNLTWSPSNSIAFSTSASQSATRKLSSGVVPSATAGQSPIPPSLYDNPHRPPPPRGGAQDDQKLVQLGAEKERLEKENESQRAVISRLSSNRVSLETQVRTVKVARQSDHANAQAEIRRVRRDVQVEADRMLESNKFEMMRQNADNIRTAKDSVRAQQKLESELRQKDEDHARDLVRQYQESERQHGAELRDALHVHKLRDSQRQSYEGYRKVYDELTDSFKASLSPMIRLQETYRRAAKFSDRQPSFSAGMDKINPLITRSKADVLKRLDGSLHDSSDIATLHANDIRSLRVQYEDLTDNLKGAAHVSRLLTRFHRMEAQNKLSATDTAYWVANDQRFRERRDHWDQETSALRRQIEATTSEKEKTELDVQLSEAERKRIMVNRILAVHTAVRNQEALKALLADSIVEKEVFAQNLAITDQIDGAAAGWSQLTGEAPSAVEDSDVSLGDQKTSRRDYIVTSRDARREATELEVLVRKRVLLQQKLGQLAPDREGEIDAIIQKRIEQCKRAEHESLSRLGLDHSKRTSRSSSFARSVSVPAPVRRASIVKSIQKPKEQAPRREPYSAPADSHILPSSDAAVRISKKDVEREIEALKAQIEGLSDGKELAHAEAKFKELHTRHAELSIPLLQQKRAVVLRARSTPATLRRLRALDGELSIYEHRATGNTGKITLSRSSSRAAKRRLKISESDSVSKEPKGASRTQFTFRPTSVNRAAVAFWPIALRRYHSDGSIQVTPSYQDGVSEYHHSDLHFLSAPNDQHELEALTVGDGSISAGSYIFADGSRKAKDDSNGRKQDSTATKTTEIDDDATTPRDQSSPNLSKDNFYPSVNHAASETAEQSSDGSQPIPWTPDIVAPLAFQISPDDYRAALKASPNTSAAYWSYALYKDASGNRPSVRYCKTMEQAERELQHFVGQPVLGFDIEWEPGASKKHPAKQNVSLIQLACEDRICLIHIAFFRGDGPEHLMPPTLRSILESEQVIKAGVNINGDAKRISQYLGVDMVGQFELSYLFKIVTFAKKDINKTLKQAGLAAQVQSVLMLPLKKDEVRVSSWSKPLSIEQSDYSASDAYAGFRLFHALEEKRKAMDPMPPRPVLRELNAPIVLGDGTSIQVQARKARVPAANGKAEELDDDVDDEFFDAVDTQDTYAMSAGVPLAGVNVAYPALPVQEASTSDADANGVSTNTKVTTGATMDDKRAPAEPTVTSKKGVPPASPEMERADAWLTQLKASLPSEYNLKAGAPSLRAYHLWHAQAHDVRQVAALARSPPLAPQTVASYILEAIKHEDLPFNAQRIMNVLGVLPSSVHGRYRKVLEKMSV